MTRLLLVALGGALGSMARYGVGQGAARLFPGAAWPWGTLTVNVVGGLASGVPGEVAGLLYGLEKYGSKKLTRTHR